MKDERKYGTISLPLPLINSVKEKIEGTGIHSVSAYVAFILRQILSSSKKGEVLDKEDEEDLKNRLKSLGYL
tara:strand:- start:8241 stop:8456 length:216 start_codon:yes stop_codon:yes gene_type:complete